MNLPDTSEGGDVVTNLPGDALDFFGTIRSLVEQSIQPEDLQKYASSQGERGGFLMVNGGYGGGDSRGGAASPQHQIVEQLRRENGALRGKVWELEQALQESQENSHSLVSGRGREMGLTARQEMRASLLARIASQDIYVDTVLTLISWM